MWRLFSKFHKIIKNFKRKSNKLYQGWNNFNPLKYLQRAYYFGRVVPRERGAEINQKMFRCRKKENL